MKIDYFLNSNGKSKSNGYLIYFCMAFNSEIMKFDTIRTYCLSLPGAAEKFPFDEQTIAFTIKDKIFALMNIETCESINLKCDPEKAIEIRETHESVLPGYHMNKKHWNTIMLDYTIPESLILQWIKDSYELVIAKLPKKHRMEING